MTSLKNLLCAFALVTSVGTAHVVSAEERFPRVWACGAVYSPLVCCFDGILEKWQVNENNPCSPEYSVKREALLVEAQNIYKYANTLIKHSDDVRSGVLFRVVSSARGVLIGVVLSALSVKLGFLNNAGYDFAEGAAAAAILVAGGTCFLQSLETPYDREKLVTLRDSIKRFVEAQGLRLD